jgi:hypothetical protein
MKSLTLGMLLSAALLPAPVQAQQTAAGPDVLAIARTGDNAGAWRAWNSLPDTPDKLRVGVRLSVATQDLPRGLALYDQLTQSGRAPDRASLLELAAGAASDLARAPADVRATACTSALVLRPAQQPCRGSLEAMTRAGADIHEQSLGYYALANAGLVPAPELLGPIQANLTTSERLQFAQMFTRLSPAERLFFIQPLLEDPDLGNRLQARLVACDIPGADVAAALKNVEAGGPGASALMVALARHGDGPSLAAAADEIDNLGGYQRLQAALALAAAGDPRGATALREIARGDSEISRVQAAAGLMTIDRDLAVETLRQALTTGSAALATAALHAAGLAGLGTDPAVYHKLTHPDPLTRAYAIEAISSTLSPPAR